MDTFDPFGNKRWREVLARSQKVPDEDVRACEEAVREALEPPSWLGVPTLSEGDDEDA